MTDETSLGEPNAFAIGAFVVNLTAGAGFLAACGMAAGNTLEAVIGVWLLRRFAGTRGLLDRISGVIAFVVIASGLSTMVSATIGVTSGWLGGVIAPARTGEAWLTWWLGDALGNLVVAPFLLVWAERPRVAWPASRCRPCRTTRASTTRSTRSTSACHAPSRRARPGSICSRRSSISST